MLVLHFELPKVEWLCIFRGARLLEILLLGAAAAKELLQLAFPVVSTLSYLIASFRQLCVSNLWLHQRFPFGCLRSCSRFLLMRSGSLVSGHLCSCCGVRAGFIKVCEVAHRSSLGEVAMESCRLLRHAATPLPQRAYNAASQF